MIRYRHVLLLAGAGLAALAPTASLVQAETAERREGRTVEPGERWQERAPRQLRERSPRHRRKAPERDRAAAGIELVVDGEWLERWHGLEFHEDRGGPDVCRQRGRITWSTRRLACPDRLPIEGLRRYSTSPD